MNKFTVSSLITLLIVLSMICQISAQSVIKSKRSDKSIEQSSYAEQPMNLETPTGILYGTLLIPKSKTAAPVVLIISGSGPTDRNGNSPLLSGPNNRVL